MNLVRESKKIDQYEIELNQILEIISQIPNVDNHYKIGILARMDTEEKAQKMLQWLNENPQVRISDVMKKAVEIKQKAETN